MHPWDTVKSWILVYHGMGGNVAREHVRGNTGKGERVVWQRVFTVGCVGVLEW